MTKTTRREFLKVLASLPVLALPRPKIDEVLPEVQQNDKALLAGIERANTKLIDNANFDVELPPMDEDMLAFPIISWSFECDPDEIKETANFLDALEDTVATIEAQADALTGEPVDAFEALVDPDLYGQFERAFDHALARRWNDIEPGAAVYLSWDKGKSWQYEGKFERLLDSCECAPMEWHVEYKQCEPVEAEYAKCTACKDGKIITDFDCYDLGNCDSLCASEHIGAAVDRKAQDEQV